MAFSRPLAPYSPDAEDSVEYEWLEHANYHDAVTAIGVIGLMIDASIGYHYVGDSDDGIAHANIVCSSTYQLLLDQLKLAHGQLVVFLLCLRQCRPGHINFELSYAHGMCCLGLHGVLLQLLHSLLMAFAGHALAMLQVFHYFHQPMYHRLPFLGCYVMCCDMLLMTRPQIGAVGACD